jgi:DDE family transposase
MRPHTQTRRRTRHPARPPDRDGRSAPRRGFLAAWDQMVGAPGVPTLSRRRGRKPRVPLSDLLPALTFHVMSGAGSLAEHFFQLFGESLADSSWADRRARLPWEIFADLMRRALRPQATRRRHRDAFWREWRLVALDGTQFSLTNTPQMTGPIKKAKTRRGRAAFAKLTTAVLVEIGWHNPLAAAIGRRGQSEWELAHSLLAQVPKGALLLADRLYGVAAFAVHAAATCRQVGSHFLLRARTSTKPRVIKRLRDGSRIIRVAVRQKGRPGRILQWLEVREIRARVGRPGHRPHELRLWTTLRDPRTAPALELAQLYARRWEHELYFRELKRQLRKTDLLQSHTVETAAQEIAAMVLATALLATERARAAAGRVPVLRVSFGKVLALVQPLWLMLGVFEDLVTDRQKNQMARRITTLMGRCVTAKRRARTNPRAVRQPVKKWPRLRHTQSVEGPVHFEVL